MRLPFAAICLTMLLVSGTALRADVEITELVLDGRPVAVSGDTQAGGSRAVRVPSSVREVVVSFRNAGATTVGPAPRLRYRLDGVDSDWHDIATMGRAIIEFHHRTGGIIDSEVITIAGTSPGWEGSVDRSPFVAQSLSATAPRLATNVRLNVLSIDSGLTVGVIGIDDVQMTIEREGVGTTDSRPIPIELSGDAFEPTQSPEGWGKSGDKAAMSQVALRDAPQPHPTLLIVDDEPKRYGGWHYSSDAVIEPGDRVTFTWRSAWSLGGGGAGAASYKQLKPGNYRFHVAAFTPGGEPTPVEASLLIEVYLPWWLRRDVWVAAGATALAATVAGVRSASLRRMKQRLVEIERAHALERERTRIARDLHDDVGAGLTEIAMKAEWVRDEIEASATPETLGLTDEIRSSAHSLVRGIDAIVWAVNPANDTLERFAAYVVQSTEQFLEAADLDMRFDIPADLPPRMLNGAVRHRLFLATREAVHNAVKHARAAAVTVALAVNGKKLELSISDDGRGFDAAAAGRPGHDGLANMHARLLEIGGTCRIESGPGRGTRLIFTVPLSDEPAQKEPLHA
jgi:hypothetical protein